MNIKNYIHTYICKLKNDNYYFSKVYFTKKNVVLNNPSYSDRKPKFM